MTAQPRRPDIALFYTHLRMGGVPRLAVWLANGFAARGLEVDLVVGRLAGSFPHAYDPRVKVIDLGGGGKVGMMRGLFHYMRSVRPRNVLSFVSSAIAMVGIANLACGRPSHFIACEQIDTWEEMARAPFGLYKVTLWAVPFTYRLADSLVAASEGVAAGLARVMRIDRKRIGIVYNPAYRPEIDSAASEPVEHPWLATQPNSVFVTAARFVEQKDLHTLLRAFKIVWQHSKDARLIILGDGPQRGELEAARDQFGLAEAVAMPGPDANPFRWFSRAHTFVMSSRWEGFGMTLVEAMACGCSIVSTDCPSGPAEILASGKYGQLVPVGDYGALAEAMLKTLDAPRAENGNRHRAREFSVDACIDRYTMVMRS
jgi:glycosyltransferase involved in cell wall biosynthesis